MKLSHFFLLFCIGAVLFFSFGCNDDPDKVGSPTQPSGDFGTVQIDTFYATGHSSIKSPIYTSIEDRFMIGKYHSYQAWACLLFAGWPDTMIGVTVTGATIRLKSVYHFGQSMSTLPINVYRARANCTGSTLSYDSLNLNTVAQPPYNYYYDIDTRYPATIQAGDTDWVTINIPDTTMLREWFSTNSDTLHLNDGLILKPDPSFSNGIRGFYSYYASDTSFQPALYVNYESEYGPKTYVHKMSNSKFVSTVDQASLITDPSLTYIQSGVAYRGLISFDSILTTWPVSVHRAVLQVTLNKSKSSSQFLHDSLYALSVGTDSVSDGSFYALSQLLTDSYGNTVYSFESTALVKLWQNNSSARKIALSSYSETSCFDLFTLYSEAAEKKLKPRIIITYSVKR